MTKGFNIVLSIAALIGTQLGADARNNYNVTDGYGDGFVINHGFFNTGIGAVSGVQDRLGDKYVKKHGLFSKETDVNLLGNRFEKRKGLFGTSYSGGTMLGDSVTTKKTWFGLGPRQTNVNLSGVAGIVQQVAGGKFGHKAPAAATFDPNAQASATGNPADFPVDPAFNLSGTSGAGSASDAATSNTLPPFSKP